MENRSPARVQARGLQRTHAQEAGKSAVADHLRFWARHPPAALAISASRFAELSAEVADQLSTAQEAIAAETYRGTAAH